MVELVWSRPLPRYFLFLISTIDLLLYQSALLFYVLVLLAHTLGGWSRENSLAILKKFNVFSLSKTNAI